MYLLYTNQRGSHIVPMITLGRGFFRKSENHSWERLTVDHPESMYRRVGPVTRSDLALALAVNENTITMLTSEQVREMIWMDIM